MPFITMKRIVLIIACLVLASGCVSRSEHDIALDRIARLESELSVCSGQVAELQQPPEERLARARQAAQEGNTQEAERVWQTLIRQYPDTDEAQLAQAALANLTQANQEKGRPRQNEKRQKPVDVQTLRATSRFQTGPLSIHIIAAALRDQWEFDRYANTAHYVDAKRGQRYVVLDLDIASTTHNPSLPPLHVYRMEGNLLVQQGRLAYKFARWDDEPSYHGHTTDTGNDFAYTKMISFTAGLILEEPLIYEPLFILAGNTGCFNRVTNASLEPPVQYVGANCGGNLAMPLGELEQKGYTLVKILNESAL